MNRRDVVADKEIYLGNAGEFQALKVTFPIPEEWEGVSADDIDVQFQQPGSKIALPYKVQIIDNKIVWNAKEIGLVSGKGQLQLTNKKYDFTKFEPGEYPFQYVGKTMTYDTWTDKSVNERITYGDDQELVDKMLALVAAFEQGLIPVLKYVDELPEAESAKAGTIYVVNKTDVYLFTKDGAFIKLTGGSSYPAYEGPYSFVPKVETEQTGEAKEHYMIDDIKVEKIPRADVSNPQGGKTTTIG